MELRQLGRSALTVPAVGLGANNFGRVCDLEQTRAVVMAALEAGMTLIDTADSYTDGASETVLGTVLRGHRHKVLISTKFGQTWSGTEWIGVGTRANVRESMEGCLRRLQTEYVDIFSLHHPDPVTPVEETLGALNELVQEGKVRFVGGSNCSPALVAAASAAAERHDYAPMVANQAEYHLLDRRAEAELAAVCLEAGVGIVATRPLAHGFLTGKYRRGEPAPPGTRLGDRSIEMPPADFDRVAALEAYARERDLTLVQVALGYLLAQPAVGCALVGATSPAQVRANAAASEWRPDDLDLVALRALLDG